MTNINKVKLVNITTPIVKLNKMIDSTSIYMKRDDLIDFYFGGNKVRLYEYIAADVIAKNADKLITFGSIHSNHVRVTAAVASRLGIECDIIIINDKNHSDYLVEGNSLLIDLIGANKFFCNTQNAREYIDEHLLNQKNKGINHYFVPGGGHTPIATMAYSDLMGEILEQSSQIDVDFDAIFLPIGTGTTQAGLVHGKNRFKFKGEILGVTVAREAQRCKKEVVEMITGLNDVEFQDVSIKEADVNVLDNEGIAYGEIEDRVLETMKSIAKSDGIVLDPIYNSKSFYVMTKYLFENRNFSNVLYLNTGGNPNIFTQEISRKVGLR